MIKAKKGLLIGLFAVMMVFAFGATSAFASQVPAADVIKGTGDTAATTAKITNVDWSDPTAVIVDVQNNAGTESAQYQFDLMTKDQIDAIKAKTPTEAQYIFYLEDTAQPDPLDGSIYVDKRELKYLASYGSAGNYQWSANEHIIGETGGGTIGLHWAYANDKIIKEKLVIDMANQYVYNENGSMGDSLSVDAGDYSAWLKLKDLTDTTDPDYQYKAAVDRAAVNWVVTSVFTNEADKVDEYADLANVEYGAYDAFSYDVNGSVKTNKKTAITITPNVAAIEAFVGKMSLRDVIILDTPRTIELTCSIVDIGTKTVSDGVVTGSRDYWTAWDLPLTATQPIEGWYETTFYDGAEHAAAFTHIGEAVTVKYAVFEIGTKLSDGTVVTENTLASALKDADWADSAVIKDAGKYMVFAKMTLDRNPVKVYTGEMYKRIYPFPIAMGFLQKQLKAEYGKYDKASLEAAVKNLFMWSNNAPDSKDAIAQVIDKYGVVVGLFTDAGKNNLFADVDTTALAADAALSEAVKNYKFADIYAEEGDSLALARGLAKVGVPCISMELEITQIANTVDFEAVSKTYKAKALKKKAKKFQLNATATYGEVKYAKVAGSAKIKVSKTGKVTVKKGTKKGTYKVKVKAYVDGTANYSAASQTVKMVIKVKK